MSDPVTAQSVDTLLRIRADTNLNAKIDALLAPIVTLLVDAQDQQASKDQVAAFKAQIFAAVQLSAQQNEIAAFLAAIATIDLVEVS